MDAQAVEMLTRGLLTHQSKRERADVLTFATPVGVMGAHEVAPKVKVPPAFEFSTIAKAADPPMLPSPPIEAQVP